MSIDRSWRVAAIGGIAGGSAGGAAMWAVALAAVQAPADLDPENWIGTGIWLVGALLAASVAAIVAFAAGTTVGAGLALRLVGADAVAATAGLVLVAEVITVPPAVWAVVSIDTSVPLWLVLTAAVAICGGLVPGFVRHLVVTTRRDRPGDGRPSIGP